MARWHDGPAVHACHFAIKEYRVQTRRAKRAYNKYQKAAFLQVIQQKSWATRYATSAYMHAANATDATSLECLS